MLHLEKKNAWNLINCWLLTHTISQSFGCNKPWSITFFKYSSSTNIMGSWWTASLNRFFTTIERRVSASILGEVRRVSGWNESFSHFIKWLVKKISKQSRCHKQILILFNQNCKKHWKFFGLKLKIQETNTTNWLRLVIMCNLSNTKLKKAYLPRILSQRINIRGQKSEFFNENSKFHFASHPFSVTQMSWNLLRGFLSST